VEALAVPVPLVFISHVPALAIIRALPLRPLVSPLVTRISLTQPSALVRVSLSHPIANHSEGSLLKLF
jgi:hypothetical protein